MAQTSWFSTDYKISPFSHITHYSTEGIITSENACKATAVMIVFDLVDNGSWDVHWADVNMPHYNQCWQMF